VAALFGLEMADTAGSDSSPKVSKTASSDGPAASKQLKRSKPVNRSKPPAENDKTSGPKTPPTGSTTHDEGGGASPSLNRSCSFWPERGGPMGGIGAA
jgi:hypothetical protein